jgi:hypothetical protein
MPDQEQKVEAIIISAGLIAPRITPAMIDQLMEGVTFSTHVVPGTTTTLASAVASSGFVLCTVESACASPENFNPALGIEIALTKARTTARDKLWELEGYRLKQALHEVSTGTASKALEQIRSVLSRGLVSRREAAAAEPGELVEVTR